MPATSDTALEKTFSDLAFSHLRDKSQTLLDYLVGFQLLKQEEDGKRAVGIFGFEVDGEYFYVVAFFLNGEIHGLDSVYSVDSDIFFPLTEDWVDHLVRKKSTRLADPDSRSRAERGTRAPNYTQLKVIPGTGGSVGMKLASAMLGERSEKSSVDLPQLLHETGLAGYFKTAVDNNPELRESFTMFYPLFTLESVPTLEKTAAAEEPVIIVGSVTDAGTDQLTDEQRLQVLEGGVAVVDKRPEVDKAKLYSTESHLQLIRPVSPGLYDVLMSNGDIEAALVLESSFYPAGRLVYRLSDKKAGIVSFENLYAVREYTPDVFVEKLDELGSEVDSVRRNDCAILASYSGNAVGPVKVENKITGVDGTVTIRLQYSPFIGAPYPAARGPVRHNTYGFGCPAETSKILVSDSSATKAERVGSTLVLGRKGFKKLPCDIPVDLDASAYLREEDFGGPDIIKQSLLKVGSAVRVWRESSEVHVKLAGAYAGGGTEADALRVLIQRMGVNEADAREAIKTASVNPTDFRYLHPKLAADFLQLPETMDASDGGFMSALHPEQIPFGNFNRSQPQNNREFYSYTSPFAGGDSGQDTFGVVEQAAKTGQKEVFDAAALSSLIKSHRPDSLVDKFVPALVTGMDRVGRILFLVYWHYSAFEERYGDSDLNEFIDNLKSVFEQVGDIVLFCKRRTVSGSPDYYGVVSLPGITEEA